MKEKQMQNKQNIENKQEGKNLKQGFTLLELLVVVVIIGILAAIALPQYKMAVGKARFSTLKNITRSIQQSAQRYYLVNGTYDLAAKDLDIDLDIISGADGRTFSLRSGVYCSIWKEGQQERVACDRNIFKTTMRLYIHRETGKPIECYVTSVDKNDNANKLCQKETGKTAKQAACNNSYCQYIY